MEQAAYETIPVRVVAFQWTGDPSDLDEAFSWMAGAAISLGAQLIPNGSEAGKCNLMVGGNSARPGDWLVLLRSASWQIMDPDRFQTGFRRAE